MIAINTQQMSQRSHMSRVVLGFTIALMVFSADPALAGDQPVLLGIGTKLLRGLINVGTGWLEMPKQIYQVARDKGVLLGLTSGPIDGHVRGPNGRWRL